MFEYYLYIECVQYKVYLYVDKNDHVMDRVAWTTARTTRTNNKFRMIFHKDAASLLYGS